MEIDDDHVSVKLVRMMHAVFPNLPLQQIDVHSRFTHAALVLRQQGYFSAFATLSSSSPIQITTVRNDRTLDLQVRAKSSDISAWRATTYSGNYYRSYHS